MNQAGEEPSKRANDPRIQRRTTNDSDTETHSKAADDGPTMDEEAQSDDEETLVSNDEPDDQEANSDTQTSFSDYPQHSPPSTPDPGAPSSKPDSRRRSQTKSPRVFRPSGYQTGGITILDSKPRPKGYVYLADWKLKPGNAVWLSETSVVKHYPEACKEYVQTLKKKKATRKLAGIIKSAGHITIFL